ncbi:erythromycin biosynthesis sensory transduction protein eryC1 [candidate division KSB1 bacterium]|nr:MAG: erythromycin biosynthesis sensory transduction protein eryC1 [candidate division KSB1 bacterium]
MKVPFVDLKVQYQSIKEEIFEALNKVLDNTAFILGKEVQLFEEEFAEYQEAKYGVAVNSGTTALLISLLCLEIGRGDEVIIPANTFIATAEAVSFTGAKPVLVDVKENTMNIDVNKIEEKITDKTKAIIPVHLYGQPADMDVITEIAQKYKLVVIEDACQAHGAEYKGKKTGSLGKIGCFSFYPGKNLGAYGEGGIILTDDKDIAKKARMIRDHGSEKKYYHNIKGINGRMEGFQGAILRVKLKYLDEWIDARRKNARRYNEILKSLDVITPYEESFNKHVYHLYVVRIKKREQLQNYLKDKEIFTGIHYPIPIHLQESYKDLGCDEGDFPVTEMLADEILSLPMYPELSDEQIEYVCENIKEFLSKYEA